MRDVRRRGLGRLRARRGDQLEQTILIDDLGAELRGLLHFGAVGALAGVGIDAREGRVAVEGWASESELDATDLAKRFADAGVAAVVYTDIERDGMMQGVNVEATVALASESGLPVIASGGISQLEDVHGLMQHASAGICLSLIHI